MSKKPSKSEEQRVELEKKIETAINGRAEYLVTRDKRLLKLPLHVDAYVKARGVIILRDIRRESNELDFCTVLRPCLRN